MFDLVFEQGKGDVFCLAVCSAQLFDHAHGAVCVPSVNNDGRGALQARIGGEPEGYGVASLFVVGRGGTVVFRQEVVIEEDRVIKVCAEQFLSFGDRFGDVQLVAAETSGEPLMPERVIIQQEDANRMARSRNVVDAKPAQQAS